jgi:hypothetical protein
MPTTLRTRLIRLAHAHPEFRADILPLLEKSADQNDPDYWMGLDPKKPGIADPPLKQAAWENLPKGWTSDSVQSMWDTMTDGVKHKITKCMSEMEGKVDDTGTFCGSLAAQVGYKRASAREPGRDATLLRRAMIRVAHDDAALRAFLLPCITRRA